MCKAMEKAGFDIHSVENVSIHYSLTIKSGTTTGSATAPRSSQAYGERWYRLWHLFLAWSWRIGAQGNAACFQIVAHKNLDAFDRKVFVGRHSLGQRPPAPRSAWSPRTAPRTPSERRGREPRSRKVAASRRPSTRLGGLRRSPISFSQPMRRPRGRSGSSWVLCRSRQGRERAVCRRGCRGRWRRCARTGAAGALEGRSLAERVPGRLVEGSRSSRPTRDHRSSGAKGSPSSPREGRARAGAGVEGAHGLAVVAAEEVRAIAPRSSGSMALFARWSDTRCTGAASRTKGAGNALVGHASRQRVQVPAALGHRRTGVELERRHDLAEEHHRAHARAR